MKLVVFFVHRGCALLLSAAAALAGSGYPVLAAEQAAVPASASALPERLSDAGLFVDGSRSVRADNLPFTPQYPLWSDGATKRRWLYLPPGTAIDATQSDAWEFPRGTRLWKEFSLARPVETRLIERLDDGSWRYAAYVWNADGSDALLAPSEGIASLPAEGAPGGSYIIPSHEDCRACHEGAAVPVLGLSALQLSPDRDPNAPNADPRHAEHVDLRDLVARGLLRNVSPALLESAPRISESSPTARAALGYMHANCGHCHNDRGPLAELELVLLQPSGGAADLNKVLQSTIDHPSESRALGLDTRVVPGHPEDSQLTARMRSRNSLTQMPPLGTQLIDREGLALIERWIQQLQP